MLTYSERLRLLVKDAEFRLPVPVVKLALETRIVRSPYVAAEDELRAIFIHIPKAAGTSIRKALYGTKSFHIPAVRYLAEDGHRFDSYFKFCFVRNPWDRICSAYHYLSAKRDADPSYPDHRWAAHYLSDVPSFRDFVLKLHGDQAFCSAVRRYIHFRDQADWITTPADRHRPLVDFVGRYERLSEDYRYLESKLGLSTYLTSERVRTDRQDYRRMYDNRMVDIIARLYALDVALFDYEFE